MLKRLLFYLQANTRHGTHSPFIYAFLDKALYNKSKHPDPGKHLLYSALAHFDCQRIGFLGDSVLSREVRARLPDRQFDKAPLDMGIADRPDEGLICWIESGECWHNDSVVFVGGLRGDQESLALWKQAQRAKGVRQCLETYSAALLFFRKEQAPEHFKIRL